MMVRLIELSSSNPIFMKGKANAQKMIGRRIINEKYFCVKGFFMFCGAAIGWGTKETIYLTLLFCVK
jgi:hypothetical protein